MKKKFWPAGKSRKDFRFAGYEERKSVCDFTGTFVRQQNALLLCLQFSFGLRGRPVIKIMGDKMAIAAFPELCHNTGCMW